MPSILFFSAVTMAIILVTGANREIGLGIVQAIAGRVPNSTILIGCRTHESGEEAVRKWRDIGIEEALDILPFDIEDDASIVAAAAVAQEKYGKLDVLINNAARVTVPESLDLPDVRSATNSVLANCVTSNLIVTQAFLPLLRKAEYPRVIMTSSARGSMTRTANGEVSTHHFPLFSVAGLSHTTHSFRQQPPSTIAWQKLR
ncbi:hypothetical protein CaCOL14_008081 [Colletotrichum acutatum]